jgi:hypothetical protein
MRVKSYNSSYIIEPDCRAGNGRKGVSSALLAMIKEGKETALAGTPAGNCMILCF